jgi:hypothetical protein
MQRLPLAALARLSGSGIIEVLSALLAAARLGLALAARQDSRALAQGLVRGCEARARRARDSAAAQVGGQARARPSPVPRAERHKRAERARRVPRTLPPPRRAHHAPVLVDGVAESEHRHAQRPAVLVDGDARLRGLRLRLRLRLPLRLPRLRLLRHLRSEP